MGQSADLEGIPECCLMNQFRDRLEYLRVFSNLVQEGTEHCSGGFGFSERSGVQLER